MRTTAIINLKGGVGKTTACIMLASILASDHKKKVLCIDCDSQGNLSQFFGANTEKGNTVLVLLNGTAEYGILNIQPTSVDGVDILAGDDGLMELDLSQLKTERVKPLAFRLMVEELSRREAYDYVIFDCPPAFNAACAASLIAADDVVIPIKLDAFSLAGMTNVMRQIQSMKRINSKLRVAGILPTMWYRSAVIADAEGILKRYGFRVFPHIRRSNLADGITFGGRALNHGGRGIEQDFRKFAENYMGGNGNG